MPACDERGMPPAGAHAVVRLRGSLVPPPAALPVLLPSAIRARAPRRSSPHTHDDVGWDRTYMVRHRPRPSSPRRTRSCTWRRIAAGAERDRRRGARDPTSLQEYYNLQVVPIINAVVAGLSQNSSRKFSYVEQVRCGREAVQTDAVCTQPRGVLRTASALCRRLPPPRPSAAGVLHVLV